MFRFRKMFFVVAFILTLNLAGSTVAKIGGVTIDSVSSENPVADRLATYMVDNSGFSAYGTHSGYPYGTMWLNSDVTVGQVDQQWIIFDLGTVYDLESTKVWNYNETADETFPEAYWARTRGVDELEIFVSADKVTWTSQGVYHLMAAPGDDNVRFGETITFNAKAVRYVKFDINSNQATRWNYSDDGYVGLSEVQFTEIPSPPMEGVTIDSVSSENPVVGRLAVYMIDGSGLDVNGPGTHTSYATSNMWLNSDASYDDVSNQWIIFDLGSVCDLESTKIWNYNEACSWADPTNGYMPFWAQRRGVYEMEVLVSGDKATWTSMGLKYLTAAPGSEDVAFGEIIALNTTGVRYVKFDINSNQTQSGVWTPPDSVGEDGYVGLSEVQFVEASPSAARPNPADGQEGVDQCPVLSWKAGINAVLHDVYFGIDPNDLNIVSNDQATTTYSSGTLDPDQTYYWRIDEIDGSSAVVVGNVWSFRTDIAGELISGVTIESFSSEYEYTDSNDFRRAEYIVDGYTLDINGPDTHGGTPSHTMWMSDDYTWVEDQYVVFNLGAQRNLLKMKIWNYNEQVAPDWGGPLNWWAAQRGVDEMEVLVSPDNTNWTSLGLYNLEPAPGNDITSFGETIFTFVNNVQYVKFDVNSALNIYGDQDYVGLSEVRFYEPTSYAAGPDPGDGATDVPRNVTLNWSSGDSVISHDIYFGTTFDEVNDATVPVANQECDEYNLSDLDFRKTYYWRIDENDASATYKGDVWSFTVTEEACYPSLTGDIDGNCVVNFKDFAIIANDWLQSEPPLLSGNVSGDSIVDLEDLAIVATDWLRCTLINGSCP